MGNQIKKEIAVTKHGHSFRFMVMKDNSVECCIDDGKPFAIKRIQDGKAFFSKKQEVVVNGDTVELGSIDLGAEGLAALTEAKNAKDENPKMVEKPSNAGLGKHVPAAQAAKPVLPSCVDLWKKKVRTYKDKSGTKRKYCIHSFRIGNNSYCFLERLFPEQGLVVNPDYKISEDVPEKGGVPRKYGELMFWDYWFEGEGWKRIRELDGNELICLDIIQKQGYFASQVSA